MRSNPTPTFILAILLAATPSLAAVRAAPHDPHDKKKPVPEEEATEDGAESTAGDDALNVYEQLEVRGRADDLTGLTGAASEGSTGYLDLAARPITRAGELLETTPGLVATQHSGGGKANQYFLRGFNLDHGTDFSVRVAGVPVNMPSHGHGQGYADLSFVIPELVDRVAYRKGPYHAEAGDFSAAGSVDDADAAPSRRRVRPDHWRQLRSRAGRARRQLHGRRRGPDGRARRVALRRPVDARRGLPQEQRHAELPARGMLRVDSR